MEVIGTTIAILQLIGKVTTYTRTASGSQDERERLRAQLQACENVIHLLQDHCPSDASPTWTQSMDRLAEPGKPLYCLLKALDSVALKLLDGTSFRTALKWPFKKDEVEALIKVVDQNTTLLLVALNNDSGRLIHSLHGKFGDQKARIEELTQKVQAFGQDGQIQMQTLTKKVSGIETAHMNTQSRIDRFNSGQEKRESFEKRQNILNWLTKHDHCQQQSYVFSNRLDNTGGWFLRSYQYQKWIYETGQKLMCRGVPGAGKTILTSIVVEDLRTFSGTESDVGVAFIYCDYKLRHEQTGDMLLTSLLKQLVAGRSTLPDHIQKLYENHGEGTRSLSSEDIRATLRSVSSSYSRVFIVVDALDEGEDHHLTTLFSEVFSLQKQCGVNVIATTRPAVTERLSTLFKGAIEIEINAKDEDVQRYVEARMHELPSCISKGRLKDDIKKKILECVDGMFLLAKLHMASLKDLATAAEIRYAINNLRQGSDSYKSAYETAIQRIRGQSVSRTKLANKVLAWIVYAKRVLKASELRLALGVEVGKRKLDYDSCPDVDMMVSVCAGLVTIDESADTIRLVHYTAQTFFDNVKSTILPSAETEIAKICLTYLSLKIFARPQHGDGYQSDSPSEGEEDGELLEQYLSDSNQGSLLYEYAAQYWGVHARKAPDAHKCVMKFLSWRSYITRAYEAATKLYGYEYRKSSLVSVDGLHLASMFGLEQAVGQILRERLSDPDVVIGLEPTRYWSEPLDGTGFYLTPLTIAASQNHPRIVKMLLDSGATLGVVSLDEGNKYKGTTALNVASEGSFEIIVDILLRANAALHNQVGVGEISNLQIGQHEQSMKSTLGIGPRKSHDEIGVPLHHTLRPIVDLPDKYGWSPLFIASHRGCDKIVDMLLRHGADVNFQSESRCSPSFKVCDDGLYEVIPMLRQSSTTQRTLSQHLFSPLYVASADGRLPVVKALLHHGAKVDAINKYSLSPLYAACANGHIDIAKILLKNGANTNAPCHSYRSPLYGAASNGHIDIVKILLQKGTNVDAPCHTNYSPLHGAASNGRVEIFKLLQHQVSEINPHNDQSPSCLHGASHGGHVEIVKMLLEHGANTHLEKKAQFSPIHAAIVNKRLEVFNLLISYGANPNQTESVHTPLQIAMHWYQGEGGVYSSGQTMIKRLKELGGKTSPEYHRQTILELMRERREKKASSAEQQEPVDLPGEHS